MPTTREKTIAEQYAELGIPWIGGGENDNPDEQAAEAEAKRVADEEAAAEKLIATEAGRTALKAERDARKQAAKEAAEAKSELDKLRKEKAEADAAKAEQDEAEAIKRGEFEQLAEKRGVDLVAATAELKVTKAELQAALTLIKDTVEEEWTAAPSAVTELYGGKPDDVLAKKKFLASHAKVIAALSEKEEDTKNAFRTPKTPKPRGDGKPTTEDEKAALANTGQYSRF